VNAPRQRHPGNGFVQIKGALVFQRYLYTQVRKIGFSPHPAWLSRIPSKRIDEKVRQES